VSIIINYKMLNLMRKMILMAVLLLSITSLIQAQSPGRGNQPTPEESAKRQTEWMTTDLSLTKEQVVVVDSINLVFAKLQSELFQKASGGDRSQLRDAFQKLASDKEKELGKVLSKEQLEAYRKSLEKQRANRGNRGGGGNR
jgi:hypothetical protein